MYSHPNIARRRATIALRSEALARRLTVRRSRSATLLSGRCRISRYHFPVMHSSIRSGRQGNLLCGPGHPMKPLFGAALALAFLYGLRPLHVDAATAVDYAQASAWLCRPAAADVCSELLTSTVVSPTDGSLTKWSSQASEVPHVRGFRMSLNRSGISSIRSRSGKIDRAKGPHVNGLEHGAKVLQRGIIPALAASVGTS